MTRGCSSSVLSRRSAMLRSTRQENVGPRHPRLCLSLREEERENEQPPPHRLSLKLADRSFGVALCRIGGTPKTCPENPRFSGTAHGTPHSKLTRAMRWLSRHNQGFNCEAITYGRTLLSDVSRHEEVRVSVGFWQDLVTIRCLGFPFPGCDKIAAMNPRAFHCHSRPCELRPELHPDHRWVAPSHWVQDQETGIPLGPDSIRFLCRSTKGHWPS